MPYRLVWEDAPHDDSLTVHESLPHGVAEHSLSSSLLGGAREAWGTTADGTFHKFHHCSRCGGWIEGDAYVSSVNTLNSSRLAGRQGTEYYCRRCGQEIAFSGLVS